AQVTDTATVPMEGEPGQNGWDQLWSAQSERVAEMQRRLQSACRDAALLTDNSSQKEEATTDIRSQAAQAVQPAQLADSKQASKPLCQAVPADEGAGSYPAESEAGRTCHSIEVPQAIAHHEDITNVSNEVLQLRLLKTQHEELKSQLSRAEAQLRRLSPHAVFQLRSYLEKHFREPGLALQVQESIVRLIQCLFAVFKMEVSTLTAEALLSGARKIFRDPHSFTSKLCSTATFSSEEAKKLAPFLTSGSQFRRVREKEVNECYEALHCWLSAFYTYSTVSDQVEATVQQLDRQEWLLRRLNNQEDHSMAYPCPVSTAGHVGQAWTPAVSTVSSRSANTCAGGVTKQNSSSARVTASPLSRSRRALQGIAQTTRPVGRAREGEGLQPSRSPSPGQSSRPLARPRPVPSVAFGSPAVSARAAHVTSPIGRAGGPGVGRPRAETAPVA
ncbi:unnamed protein product, partial [Effrenium voratum]